MSFGMGSRFVTQVIPAKAGIHSPNLRKCAVYGLDSRFRGNDCGFECACLANDTGTRGDCLKHRQKSAGSPRYVPGL